MINYDQFVRRMNSQNTCQHDRRKKRFQETETRTNGSEKESYQVGHYVCLDCGLSFSAANWSTLKKVEDASA